MAELEMSGEETDFDPNIPIEQQMLYIPDRVDEGQYKTLIMHWMSDKFKEHMKELGEQERESSNSDCIHNPQDTYAKIIGEDKHGRMLMYGMGVTPTDVYGKIASRDASHRLAMIVFIILKIHMRRLSVKISMDNIKASHRMAMEYNRKYIQAMDKYNEWHEKLENLSAIVHGRAHYAQPDAQNIPLASSNNLRSSSSSSWLSCIRDHSYVVLKSMGNINEIVASGYVKEMNSIRVKDAVGAPVAWPLSLVALDENGHLSTN
ncbi:hypothetical protein BUALT_Bualt13G0070600 [Buddleja alternifolia]|uniref:Uncharacterized protein n=1 Tax=Buddleja alternifolia TaxID=168488 RepID=A0AAV6WW95_9LAMI|nr:hypothetical protein BUALT_Bualt13G0070600 [Buddleja alternifolia]